MRNLSKSTRRDIPYRVVMSAFDARRAADRHALDQASTGMGLPLLATFLSDRTAYQAASWSGTIRTDGIIGEEARRLTEEIGTLGWLPDGKFHNNHLISAISNSYSIPDILDIYVIDIRYLLSLMSVICRERQMSKSRLEPIAPVRRGDALLGAIGTQLDQLPPAIVQPPTQDPPPHLESPSSPRPEAFVLRLSPSVFREINAVATRESVTMTVVIARALQKAGFAVPAEDLKDRRKRRHRDG